MSDLASRVLESLNGYRPQQVRAALELLDDGNTIPFIARYRKEATGALDEVQLQEIKEAAHREEELSARKQTVQRAIADQGKLTPALTKQLEAARDLAAVEDLYLPYKKRRRTKAEKAREAGLAPLANWLLTYSDSPVEEVAQQYLSDQVEDGAAALAGAHEILAEAIAEMTTVRAWLREFAHRTGQLTVLVKKEGAKLDPRGVYRQYYDFQTPVRALTSYQVLAINRGEQAGVLRVHLELDADPVQAYLAFRLLRGHQQNAATSRVMAAAMDAYKRFLLPATEREVRSQLTAMADQQAIHVFGTNLYHLLMQAPLKGRVVLGFDPAFRTGCKLAVLDPRGKLLKVAVIYPHQPAKATQRQQAAEELRRLIMDYQVTVVAIGNGTASRESEQFVAGVLKELDQPVSYVIVNESGASVYSASAAARAEFPDLPVEKRSAISIGRRLQDPLAELVKIAPQALGVGQYQHDLPQGDLERELDAVVERAVNRVGVNLNTASGQLLTRIAGLTKTTAQNIVNYRDDHGAYTSREQLKQVPRLGPKAFRQAAGFLRISGGTNPLDNTDVHPESYPLARQMLEKVGVTAAMLGTAGAKAKLAQLVPADFVDGGHGEATVKDVLSALQKPGRDVRDTLPAPQLRQDVLTMADLTSGMELTGTVRNVVDFGVFVDVGVHEDGLVHRSRMREGYNKAPQQQVAVGEVVTVWVREVDEERQRIQLTMISPRDGQND